MKFLRLRAVPFAVLLLGSGCAEEAPPVPVDGAPSMAPMAHGDHNAKHDGTVWMNGDLHFEVVLNASGEHHVYFSDAYRMELPAAVATKVTIKILRTEGDPEPLALAIDEFGESWMATGRAVEDSDARAVVSFVHEGEPYEIDLPFVAEPMDLNAADPHTNP